MGSLNLFRNILQTAHKLVLIHATQDTHQMEVRVQRHALNATLNVQLAKKLIQKGTCTFAQAVLKAIHSIIHLNKHANKYVTKPNINANLMNAVIVKLLVKHVWVNQLAAVAFLPHRNLYYM